LQDILFDFNAQHDCYTAGCSATGKRALKQERINSGRIEEFVEHKPVGRFVINTHAFHNTHRLRSVRALRELLKPRLLYPDRTQLHQGAASVLRGSKFAAGGPKDTEPQVQTTKKRKRTKKATHLAVGEQHPDRTQLHWGTASVLRGSKDAAGGPEDTEPQVQTTKKRKRTKKATHLVVGEQHPLALGPSGQTAPSHSAGTSPMDTDM
jgi:hypothetical protein